MQLISIIIPTFNRASLISDTFDSIVNLNYKNWECIIIDDGSTDNTQKVIQSYIEKDKRFKFYEKPKNYPKGPNSCRNFGFEKSKGSWIKWFDSDDLFLSNAFDFFFNGKSQNVDVVVCKLQKVDFSANKILSENNILSDNLIQDYLISKVIFYVCGPTWKRSFIEKQNELFDENLSNLDDWDFNLRMLYESPKIVYIHEVLIKYRVHENSLSQEINKLNFNEIQSEFRAREKHLKLLKINKHVNPNILKSFIKDRYKYILRTALVSHNIQKKYFLNKLLIYQWSTRDYLSIPKTIFGFVIYTVFNRGYKYL